MSVKRANILTNSFWYGFELVAEAVVTAVMSIAAARVLGPAQLGPFVYLTFLTNVAGRLGGLGIAEAARRYISEYLASGQPGVARSVFFATLRIQTLLALLIPAIGIAVAWVAGDPAHFWVAVLLIASVGPALVSSIAALSNVAAENFARNVPSAIAGVVLYAALMSLTLILGWGIVGLAAAVFARRLLEMIMRITQALRWMLRLPRVPTPQGLNRRLIAFSGQAGLVMLLTLVVWDRSEVIFLKHFCDVRQLAYYSVAFGLTEQLLMLPNVVGGAIGAALMAEFGRGGKDASRLVNTSVRKLSLLVLPAHVGMAALSAPFVTALYGRAYIPAIPALMAAALLAVPKAFYWLPTTVCQAAEKQSIILRWLVITGLLNIGLNALIIPGLGAQGAAIAKGTAQAVVVLGMWRSATRIFPLETPWGALLRIFAAAAAMGAAVFAFGVLTPPVLALAGGVPLGVAVYMLALRLTRAVGRAEADELAGVATRLPGPARRIVLALLHVVTTPPAPAAERPAGAATS